MKQIYNEKDIPVEYLKEIKNWSEAFRFVTGRLDEFNTLISVWEHGGVYKIIRAFVFSGKPEPVISVDANACNSDDVMAELLLNY